MDTLERLNHFMSHRLWRHPAPLRINTYSLSSVGNSRSKRLMLNMVSISELRK